MYKTVNALIAMALENVLNPDGRFGDNSFGYGLSQELVHIGVKANSMIAGVASAKQGFDRQYNECMQIAKRLGMDSKELADKLVAELDFLMFEKVEVTGPGFINIRVSDKCILEHYHAFMPVAADVKQSILIDFGGPNIAKALHVGHLRSLVIGESLRRILILRGHDVISDIHLGDWGLPMGMLINKLLELDPGLGDIWVVDENEEQTVDRLVLLIERDYDLEALYPEVVAECKADPSLKTAASETIACLQQNQNADDWVETVSYYIYKTIWQAIRKVSLKKIVPTVERLGAEFTYWDGESTVGAHMDEFFESYSEFMRVDDGATVLDVALPTDTKKYPPLIFKKSDDGYTYAATDLVTAWDRIVDADKIIYVVDNRQKDYFETLFRATRIILPGLHHDLVHAGFGTINGKDGKPFKTRDGNVPTLNWMLDTVVAKAKERTADPKDAEIIAIGAIKYADLITNRESGYVFDLDRIMALEGKTGPYIQYAAVRIQHILDNVDTSPSRELGTVEITCAAERELLVTCANFPEILELAERLLAPHHIAEYAYQLAEKFSAFYKECYVVDYGVVNKSRVEICITVQGILKNCLYLLGIDIPGKM